jgi:C1A family cysteine protease
MGNSTSNKLDIDSEDYDLPNENDHEDREDERENEREDREEDREDEHEDDHGDDHNDELNSELASNRVYGWRRDLPDVRDVYLEFNIRSLSELPTKIELLDVMPKIYDQGHLGSCTANAIAAAFEYDQVNIMKKPDFMPSRLFIYYNERLIENSVNYDAGASIRDGMKSLNTYGVCSEEDWCYNEKELTTKPSDLAYTNALKHKAINYKRINPNIFEFKNALSQHYPVVFGFNVPSSFEGIVIQKTGFMEIPKLFERNIGGHAVVACGYDDTLVHNGNTGFLLVRNSWGENWGLNGYFWMPYAFLSSKTCDDCWVLESVSGVSESVV